MPGPVRSSIRVQVGEGGQIVSDHDDVQVPLVQGEEVRDRLPVRPEDPEAERHRPPGLDL